MRHWWLAYGAVMPGPRTGSWSGTSFAEVALDGKPIRGGTLDKATQPQPESLAFLEDGTLLVASEGGKGDAILAGYPAP